MNKKDYLSSLREFLSFELPSGLVEKNIAYYDSYFNEQIRAGKTAEEISAELGDPQLIARSCIDAAKSGADGIPGTDDDVNFQSEIDRETNGRSAESSKGDGRRQESNASRGQTRVYTSKGCLIPALILLAVLILLIAFFSTPLGSALLIAFLGAALIGALIRFFRNR